MDDPPILDAPTYHTYVNDEKSILPIGTIEYQWKLWLVPEWLANEAEGWRTPTRIICLDGHQVQDLRGKNQGADFALRDSVPRIVLDHLFQGIEDGGFEVVEHPPIRYRLPPVKH